MINAGYVMVADDSAWRLSFDNDVGELGILLLLP